MPTEPLEPERSIPTPIFSRPPDDDSDLSSWAETFANAILSARRSAEI